MSVLCTRDFSLTVAEPSTPPVPNFWWKMEEAGNLDRVDAIQGLHLVSNGAAVITGSAPGRVNDGVHYLQDTLSQRLSGAASVLMVNARTFEMCFWIKWSVFGVRVDGAFNSNQILWQPDNTPNPGSLTIFIKFVQTVSQPGDTGHVATIDFGLSVSNITTVTFEPALDTWYFVRFFFTPDVSTSVGHFGVQINNGAIQLSPLTSTIANYAKGSLSIQQVSNVKIGVDPDAVAADFVIDELMFQKGSNLTAPEVNYLYNSGAGRTYPF